MTIAVVCFLGLSGPLSAQLVGLSYPYPGATSPGAIGGQLFGQGEPAAGFFQPVEIRAPRGALISLAEGGAFAPAQPAPVRVGLLVGQVYRISVVNVPFREGLEVFPTIQILDRLHTPRGQEARFPVILDLAMEDLELALDGKFVTRVVYLEDPLSALPEREDPHSQAWFDIRPGTDPVAEAKRLGRPMAMVRMGARVPDSSHGLDPVFFFGCPPFLKLPPPRSLPEPATKNSQAAPAGAASRPAAPHSQPRQSP